MRLILPQSLRDRIEEEARAAFPRECCGLVEGWWDADVAKAAALHPARNIANGNDRFEIHPEDHFMALKAARANSHNLIGCYHSHPNGSPVPSATDRAGAREENFLWLIAALPRADGPVIVPAFAYRAGSFVNIDLEGPRAPSPSSSRTETSGRDPGTAPRS